MTQPASQQLTLRIFWFQVALIAFTTVLFLGVSHFGNLGFFWFAFIAGSFGASLSMLRQVRARPESVQETIVQSWPLTLSPFLYGSLLAGVAYFLFAAEILSGVEGQGLLKTNLFPDFGYGGEQTETVAKLSDFRLHSPKTILDGGKLMVWCFIAGYSEEFVTNIIGNLEQQISKTQSE